MFVVECIQVILNPSDPNISMSVSSHVGRTFTQPSQWTISYFYA